VTSLEALGKALFLEVLELRKERDRALESRTLAGHAKNLMGYMLSAYCLYKCARRFFKDSLLHCKRVCAVHTMTKPHGAPFVCFVRRIPLRLRLGFLSPFPNAVPHVPMEIAESPASNPCLPTWLCTAAS